MALLVVAAHQIDPVPVGIAAMPVFVDVLAHAER